MLGWQSVPGDPGDYSDMNVPASTSGLGIQKKLVTPYPSSRQTKKHLNPSQMTILRKEKKPSHSNKQSNHRWCRWWSRYNVEGADKEDEEEDGGLPKKKLWEGSGGPPEDEPAPPEVRNNKTAVWYYGTCSHNNCRDVQFDGPNKMGPGDAFKPAGKTVQFRYPGIYSISYGDDFKNTQEGTSKFVFSEAKLDFTPRAGNIRKTVPISRSWGVCNFVVDIGVKKNCKMSIGVNKGLRMDGTNNSRLLIHRLNEFPEDILLGYPGWT